MTETRDMTLGGRTFAVPRLPLEVSMKVYPLCRKLSQAGLLERVVQEQGFLPCDEVEMADLTQLALLCCQVADRELTREAFVQLPINPNDLTAAFLVARYQTGAWIAPEENAAGEVKGEASPQTLTSTESSPA